jgi:hypothetical protein
MSSRLLIIGTGIAAIVIVMIGCADRASNPPAPQEPKLNFVQSECLEGTESNIVDGQHRVVPRQLAIGSGFSECLTGSEGALSNDSPWPGGTVRFAVSYDTLFVYHDSAYYNCCPMFSFTVETSGSEVDFIEADTTTMPCDCMCYFNLDCSVAGLEPGTYTARLWTEDKAELLGEAVVTLTGAGGVFFRTSCDTLFINHDSRWANCGSVFVFNFWQDDHLLVFTEIDTSTQMLRCMCEFDLAANVSGLEAGNYVVQLRDGGNILEFGGPVDTLIAEAEVKIEPCVPILPEYTRR